MVVTFKKAAQSADKFTQEYMCAAKYPDVVAGVGITSLRIAKEKYAARFGLKAGESLDDFCLSVYLVQQPPLGRVHLPEERYMGVRVFYDVTGYPLFARGNKSN